MQLVTVFPATCELCGNWIPAHSSSCPRNGVHPSQWSLEKIQSENECPEEVEFDVLKDKYEQELDNDI
ncbi:hypothetical protein G6F37_005408 [Rhizopus arrhizus]|nr:hypothetical protein G6F38_003835 [Rhizopus arrhizus]KAG1158864.1 hypothetical protein G6F37_005408 [Rhizopus arrhizus]